MPRFHAAGPVGRLTYLLLVAGAASADAQPNGKPAVPAGVDPGGTAIAVIGGGLDYTRPEIAGRLARDGEGFVIGFDLADNDRKPYAKADALSGGCGDIGCTALPAHLALAESQAGRLAPFRAETQDDRLLAGAIGMVAKSPAHVVLIDGVAAERVLAAAAARFPALLFIAPAPSVPPPPVVSATALANVLLVRDAASATPESVPSAAPAADIAAPAGGRALNTLAKCPDRGCNVEPVLANRLAAARIAALAARLVAVEPGLDGAGLKTRIVKLANEPSPAHSRAGFIAAPEKPFRVE